MYQNRQLKRLSDALYGETLTSDDIETVKQRLQDEFLIGVTERFDESLLCFQKKLGWKKPCFYVKANVSRRHLKSNTITFDDLTVPEQQLLLDWNTLDRQLYQYACQLFDKQLQALNITHSQLRHFQRGNQFYYWKTITRNRLKSILKR